MAPFFSESMLAKAGFTSSLAPGDRAEGGGLCLWAGLGEESGWAAVGVVVMVVSEGEDAGEDGRCSGWNRIISHTFIASG